MWPNIFFKKINISHNLHNFNLSQYNNKIQIRELTLSFMTIAGPNNMKYNGGKIRMSRTYLILWHERTEIININSQFNHDFFHIFFISFSSINSPLATFII